MPSLVKKNRLGQDYSVVIPGSVTTVLPVFTEKPTRFHERPGEWKMPMGMSARRHAANYLALYAPIFLFRGCIMHRIRSVLARRSI